MADDPNVALAMQWRDRYPHVVRRWLTLAGERHEYQVLRVSATEAWRVRDAREVRGPIVPVPDFGRGFGAVLRIFTRCDIEMGEAPKGAERRAVELPQGEQGSDAAELVAQLERAEPWTPTLTPEASDDP